MTHQIKEFIESNPNLVLKKKTSDPNLFVLKYHNRCFYRDIWNEIIENTRGVVVNENYDLVSNPLRKIFNYGIESKAPKIDDDEEVFAVKKINGFMLSVSLYNSNLLFSTTGSIDSKYAKMGESYFREHLLEGEEKEIIDYLRSTNETLVYECVHPDDPHIIKEQPGMYFLASRPNVWFSSVVPATINNGSRQHGGLVPDSFLIRFKDLKKMRKSIQHEGYVVYTEDGRVTKLKSRYYLLTKFFARCHNTTKLLDRKIKSSYPEEYHRLIDYIHDNGDFFAQLPEQSRLEFIRDYIRDST